MKKKKILVIEDEAKVALVMKIRLQAAGYEVFTARDGVQGLRAALEEKPDLVITDIWMPEGGGFSVAYRLREQNPHLPVIFITASKQPGLRENARKLGAVGFLEKPYEAAELLKTVAEALAAAPSPAADPPQHPKTEFPAPESPKPEPPKQESTKPAASGGGKNILIIEDDRKIAMALAVRLKSAGYEAIIAHDAVTGVNAAVQHRPDLVLLDISMPAGNGFMVAERIQSLVPTLTPIIFLTASKQSDFRKRAEELGAAGFFEKPFDAEKLLAAIHAALNP